MSVQPQSWPEPAPEIMAAVRAAYRRREPPLPVTVRDRLGELFPDAEFAPRFGVRGRPGWSPGRLALVTVLQMAEDLTDRQAAEAVRDKISWKFALGLDLDETLLANFGSCGTGEDLSGSRRRNERHFRPLASMFRTAVL